jgi:hypothetical protein
MFTQAQYERFISAYSGSDIVAEIANLLIPIWCDDYSFTSPSAQIVEVETGESGASFSYLFDLTLDRNIVACGIPSASKHQRDRSRMAGHPLANSARYDRGHLMANATGGGCDINLVPQLAKINRVQLSSSAKSSSWIAIRCSASTSSAASTTTQRSSLQPSNRASSSPTVGSSTPPTVTSDDFHHLATKTRGDLMAV